MIGRVVEQREADHAEHLREREVIALLVVGLERQLAAMSSLVEQTKTRLAGITPSGRPA